MSVELSIQNLTAGYGAQIVLRNLSLDVESGTLTALIGPNGHGKSTLLRAISGLVTIAAGQILLAGTRIDRYRPDAIVARGIVHVPQGDLLFPDMTVLENLRMGSYLPAAARLERQRLEEVFTLLPKLRDRQQQTASTLSGGERRMVGIGRGLMTSGRILMLDEPSLGLAPIIIDQIYEVVDTLRRSGRTVILVEENAVRAADIADEIHLLDHGGIAWGGTGAELSGRPELLETYLGA
ncbi:ABC transporter ATP-binding protein [Pelagibacterium lentulum]|uniref:ABC transporter ATP-binding protein n=1 Tax=Pelagibacterium lentulum TaxID=2029865 RepID=A0A916VWE2_9HYPH|nr:ABC transporter ATP-binding protein [Pelagibacterium lentulum]GGA43847.1 ABC transporter ATP-binding protein [Pelagibacterium lentulum]